MSDKKATSQNQTHPSEDIVSDSKKNIKIGSTKLKDLTAQLSTSSSELKQAKGLLKLQKVTVTLASEAARMKRHALMGIITQLGDGTITIAHQIHRERTYQIITSDQTVIAMKGITNATFADLAVGQRIAVVGEPTQDGLLATRIHVIPGKAIGVFNKQPVASPSGSITTTPSATGSAGASPTPTEEVAPTVTPSPTPLL